MMQAPDIVALDLPCILVIDDNVDMIRLLSSMLKELGTICFATDGLQGMLLARERKPQVILLDVEMPGLDGYEVCRQIKSDSETRSTSVVFVTAKISMESEVLALQCGAADFITKPLNPMVVQARVRTQLALQAQSAALVRLAERDPLTGLYNRRYFDNALEREVQRHQRQALSLGLAFIDIDCFKAYNDNYGHQAGDVSLIAVAHAISAATLRPGEVVARYGGEEFVVIIPYCSPGQAHRYGNWVCSKIRSLGISHGHSVCGTMLTISVGVVAMVPSAQCSADIFTKAADKALYRAKSAGRDQSISSLPPAESLCKND